MKRIAVYGHFSIEKEKFVLDLNTVSAGKFSFISSTPPERFTLIETGRAPSIYTAPWQLLVVNLNDNRLGNIPEIDRIFPQCDLYRPLIIVFYGKEGDQLKESSDLYKNNLIDDQWISFISVESLDDVKIDDIIDSFNQLERNQSYPTI